MRIPVRFFPYSHGLIHGVVDTCTVMVVFSAIIHHDMNPSEALFMIIAYDLLAFAGQALLGLGMDRLKTTRSTIVAGIAFAGIGVSLMLLQPYVAMVFVGIGNALFHVGAGAVSLYTNPGRARDPGIFVAPGALGLGLGLWLGKGGNTALWPFLLLLAGSVAVTMKSDLPIVYPREEVKPFPVKAPMVLLGLLLFSISIRAFVGYAGSWECPKISAVTIGLTLAAFLGKGLGGLLSDRFGWIQVSVGALLLSAPLIAFGGSNWLVVVVGMFLFQMTMPVTLTAAWALIPRRPAFAFGICCLALIAGAFASFYKPWSVYYSAPLFIGLICVSATAIYLALRGCKGAFPMKFTAPRSAEATTPIRVEGLHRS